VYVGESLQLQEFNSSAPQNQNVIVLHKHIQHASTIYHLSAETKSNIYNMQQYLSISTTALLLCHVESQK